VAVAICTFKRNDLLLRLLDALLLCAERVSADASIGVVLVDDTPEGLARPVAEAFAGRFELGLQYRISGRKNISLARNMAVEGAMEIAEWTVMTDDDCEPPPGWLEALIDVQQRTMADAITGRMVRRVPDGSPRWITEQPFLELGVETFPDGGEVPAAATFNTMLSSRWLKDHPDIRFSPEYGVIGGEDMVFFREARAAGLAIRFSEHAFVYENEPADRATFGYQLYVYLWHGNSAALACIQSGMTRSRMFVHGCASLVRSAIRPVSRLVRGQPPQWRYFLAQLLHALGKIGGTLGVRIDHR
jgi:succinoglycan biosynthesis protein ExoM